MWNPFDKIKRKLTGTPEPAAAAVKMSPEAASAVTPEGMPDLKELEKKGMLSQFFRHWKNPAFLKQLKAIAARMQAEGVNIKDQKAVMAWVTAHEKEIAEGKIEAPAADKPQTFVKTGPEIGRNDPCTCGSGKKFKKCCGATA